MNTTTTPREDHYRLPDDLADCLAAHPELEHAYLEELDDGTDVVVFSFAGADTCVWVYQPPGFEDGGRTERPWRLLDANRTVEGPLDVVRVDAVELLRRNS